MTNSATIHDKPPRASPTSHPSSSSKCLYPLTDYVSCDIFSPSQKAFLAAVFKSTEPTSFKEAMLEKVWREAVASEITALEDQHTWDVTTLPPGKHALGCKWVFKIKYNSDGTIERFKARLVTYGNQQQEGEDFNETFAPVVKLTTVRVLLKLAATENWNLYQMDVHNAFLHGDLDEEVYMRLPPGFSSSQKNVVCKLRKSLYGLRQAPRCWFAKLSQALLKFGFIQNRKDYSLFSYVNKNTKLYVLVYVDDLVIGGNNEAFTAIFKAYLSQCFRMKDLGVLKYFLGIEVSRANSGIYLSQIKYALDINSECGLSGSKPFDTPVEQNHTLGLEVGEYHTNPAQYRRLFGRLVYLVITRPELSFEVHLLSQFMGKPHKKHWEAAVQVVRYLKGCTGQSLFLDSQPSLKLAIYCDAD